MQETSVAFFSHRFETLTEYFIRNFYDFCANPFEKKLVVVPHFSMKSYLMQTISNQLGIAAGLKIVTLSQAIGTLFAAEKKIFPKFLELSLSIQHELLSLLDEGGEIAEPLVDYLQSPSSSLRMAQLSDLLSLTFLDYSEYGGIFLQNWLQEKGWQQQVWKKVFASSTFHYKELLRKSSCSYSLHLFGFHFIPPLYFHFFKNRNASFYLFSPCQTYWADHYSDKEGNRFLANWGKVGRKCFTMILDQDLHCEETYPLIDSNTTLGMIQKAILEDQPTPEIKEDGSIQLIAASSKLREIELLHENLSALSLEPHQIAVYAPDINVYAPYIHAVFSQSHLPYSMANLKAFAQSPLLQAWKQLMQLPQERFSKEAVLKLLSFAPFKEKFHLSSENIATFAFWMEHAGVRWGSDSMQRQLLLSQMEALEDGQVGTWEMGMDRLLLGIAKTDEGLIPLSEVELFNQLLCILRALQQDLKPLFDGSERSIPDWIDFFAKLLSSYFNEEGGFLQELRYLREATAHLNKNRVCYEAIERILSSFFDKKQTRFQAPHLHGIQFRSIISGGIFPAKAIYLLGMQEGAFPRKNRFKLHAPEFHKTGDYRPTQTEEDRFLFLQLLLSAREKLFLSYQKISEEEQTFLRPSILIEELLPAFKIEEEPAHFTPTSATSPLLPELYLPLKMEAQKEDLNINLEQLASFAKHPLLYYLRQKLQMKIGSFEKNEEEEEFILSSLSKKKLREQALRMPLEQLLHEAEIKGALPRALFKKVALQTIKAEVENLEEHLNHFGVSKEQIQTEKIALKVVLSNQSVITLEGRLEGISPKGLLFYGENELSDLVKVWPLFLIYSIQRMPPTLLFTKTGESRTIALADPLLALQRYLEYYQLALNYGSPLIPKLAKPLLKGSIDELEKKLEELVSSSYSNDKTLKWLFDRDKLPIASAIFENWVALLKEVHDPL